jgi:hypothetical protein
MTLFYPHYKIQWIRLREKMQETPCWTGKSESFRLRFSRKPIHWNMESMIYLMESYGIISMEYLVNSLMVHRSGGKLKTAEGHNLAGSWRLVQFPINWLHLTPFFQYVPPFWKMFPRLPWKIQQIFLPSTTNFSAGECCPAPDGVLMACCALPAPKRPARPQHKSTISLQSVAWRTPRKCAFQLGWLRVPSD